MFKIPWFKQLPQEENFIDFIILRIKTYVTLSSSKHLLGVK